MGLFEVNVGVGPLNGTDLTPVSAMVDTGAAHSVMPESFLNRLRCAPLERQQFVLADGSRVEYGYGMARFGLQDRERPCPVIFGPEGNYLLGASTLEIFNLVVDSSGQRLAPAEWLSLGWGGHANGESGGK